MGDIWIGMVDGDALVYDPGIQIRDAPHVFIWSRETKSIGKYDPSMLRKHIRRLTDKGQWQDLYEDYMEWKSSNTGILDKWRREQQSYYTERSKIERRFEERLEERDRRVTNCHSCGKTLDNGIELECEACGWILCDCGACGCGFG